MIRTPYFDVIILSIVGLIALVLAIFVFAKYQKSPRILSFGFLTLAVSGWILGNGPPLLFDRTSAVYDLWTRFAFLFAILIFHFLYLFIVQFPFPSTAVDQRFLAFFFVPPAIIGLLLLFSNNLVSGFRNDIYGSTIFGRDYWLYAVYVLAMFALVLYEGFRKRSKLDGTHRVQMNILLSGVLFSGLIAIITQLVLPYVFQIQTQAWIGPGFSAIWIILVAYILIR